MVEVGKKDKITSHRLMKYQTNKNQIILPSFGGFTGMHFPKIKNNDKVFVITKREIIEVKEKLNK